MLRLLLGYASLCCAGLLGCAGGVDAETTSSVEAAASSPAATDCTVLAVDPTFGREYRAGRIADSGNVYRRDSTFPDRDNLEGRIATSGTVYKRDPTFGREYVDGRIAASGTVYRRDPTFGREYVDGRIAASGTVYRRDPTFGREYVAGRIATSGTVYERDSTFPDRENKVGRFTGTCPAAYTGAAAYFFFFFEDEPTDE
jgi:hypothetical protein